MKYFKWLPHHSLDKALAYAEAAATVDLNVNIVLRRQHYTGTVEYSPALDTLHGKLQGVKGVVTYDAGCADPLLLIKFFSDAVADYRAGVEEGFAEPTPPETNNSIVVDLDTASKDDIADTVKLLRLSIRDAYLKYAMPWLAIYWLRWVLVNFEFLSAAAVVAMLINTILKVTL